MYFKFVQSFIPTDDEWVKLEKLIKWPEGDDFDPEYLDSCNTLSVNSWEAIWTDEYPSIVFKLDDFYVGNTKHGLFLLISTGVYPEPEYKLYPVDDVPKMI